MTYHCEDIFLIRRPALPLSTFIAWDKKDGGNNDFFEFLEGNKLDIFLEEALLISSPDLYAAIKRVGKDTQKDYETCLSAIKYLTRATTRPTPFGTLAQVTLGSFKQDGVHAKLKSKSHVCKRIISVDMHWISRVVHLLEQKPSIRGELCLKWNHMCYEHGERVKNPNYTCHGDIDNGAEKIKRINIRFTPLIKMVKESTVNSMTFNELKVLIKKRYEDVEEEKIEEIIATLIEKEYLLTELRIPSYCNDSVQHVINVLKDKTSEKELVNKLENLQNLMLAYSNQRAVCQDNVEILKKIYAIMKSICVDNNYLNVSSASICVQDKLSKDIKERLELFIDNFSRLYVNEEHYSRLTLFKRKFIEEFGQNIEVPLHRIIDENGFNGLELIEEGIAEKSNRDKRICSIIDDKIIEAIREGSEEVNLLSSDFDQVKNDDLFLEKLSDSFDINFMITGIQENVYLTIGPNYGSNKAGDTFQRFSDILDLTDYNTMYRKMENDKYKLVEARELSVNGRANNLLNRKKNLEYALSFGQVDMDYEKALQLDDILIGMDSNDKLYIKSRKLNKKCKFVSDNMLNYSANSKVFILLKEISNEYEPYKVIDRFLQLYENRYAYIPRINFEDICIQPKTWFFNYEFDGCKNLGDFFDKFNNLRKKRNIDKYVYLLLYDNRMLINLEKHYSIEMVYEQYKRNGSIKLCEIEKYLFQSDIYCGENLDTYVLECIFSFIKEKTQDRRYINEKPYKLEIEDDIFYPFKEGWVYLNLYTGYEWENYVIDTIKNNFLSQSDFPFYYVRYSDEIGRHIRIRIKFESEKEAIKMIPQINFMLEGIRSNGYLQKWSYNQYKREVNRYGGKKLIEDVEFLFWMDSKCVNEEIEVLDFQEEDDIELAYIINIASLLYSLTGDKQMMFALLDTRWDDKTFRKIIHKNKQKYLKMLDNILNKKYGAIDQRLSMCEESLLKRDEAALGVKNRITILGNELNNSPQNIILSIVHMSCNRLLADTNKEIEYHTKVRHMLYMLLEKEKHI